MRAAVSERAISSTVPRPGLDRTVGSAEATTRRSAYGESSVPPRYAGGGAADLDERPAGEPLIGGDVALTGGGDDVVRQLGRRGDAVPAGGGQPVADVLLVVGGLRRAGRPGLGGAETRRNGGQHLLGPHQVGSFPPPTRPWGGP